MEFSESLDALVERLKRYGRTYGTSRFDWPLSELQRVACEERERISHIAGPPAAQVLVFSPRPRRAEDGPLSAACGSS